MRRSKKNRQRIARATRTGLEGRLQPVRFDRTGKIGAYAQSGFADKAATAFSSFFSRDHISAKRGATAMFFR